MSQQQAPQHQQQFQQEEEINLREELEKYLRFWPYFIASVLLCLIIAFFYLRYSTPVFQSTATIIIKDEKKGGIMSELSAFEDMGILSGMGGGNSIENEMGILRSKQLITDVAKELQLNIRYFLEGDVQTTEIYAIIPIEIQLLTQDDLKLSAAKSFKFINKEGTNFSLVNTESQTEFKGTFGKPVDLDFATIIVTKNQEQKTGPSPENNDPLIISFSTVDAAAGSYRGKIQLSLTDKNSSLIEINLNDPVKEKARDILNQLIFEYNRQAIDDKNLVAINTAKFIEDRLDIITGELDSVETGKENFKESNQLTDIQAESEMFIENASEFNKKRQDVNTQLELSNAMLDYLAKDSDSDLLPANLGISETGVNNVISEYNSLVLERNRILRGSTEKNPVIIDLNSQISQIKGNVRRSLERMRANLRIARQDLDSQASAMGSKIASVPGKEKQFRGIERQQNIKEALYLFLLQKREETSLSLAVTAPKAKIVDAAYTMDLPVSPKKKIIFLAALILGLLIPFLIIYLKHLLNNKIHSQQDMQVALKTIPLVGEIPRIAKAESEIITENDRSVLSESFRILHTNLQYLLVNAGNDTDANVLFVTSTVKGEGKTFIAFNLALTLANSGKKVLIMGADLRNPQLQRYEEDFKTNRGISDYLVNKELELKSLIKTSETHENLDLLASGSIPPNPSELWRTNKSETLFASLKENYDYVVVDTAPVMLVTDTFLISKYADLVLYVTRAGYTEKKLLNFAVDSQKAGKLHDVSFVLNDVKLANFGYGNKYGYAYGVEKEGFWQKLKAGF
ncbi:capsular exopolysaccharide synthesis family protein [Gillisia sp. Hel_I_86]|uniref:GumC family protein n=1 Tax=Gillisia sp. Hel_I_86 TaxID=1249981 RepID=UPI00119B0050|nr:tyrosine-protein kinase family protein [Gillisia sp. Hel_I_86]TVZ26034.1 capsular exopolysaccharide synthesis family protein [Gillisia sp. Hel_I_86]